MQNLLDVLRNSKLEQVRGDLWRTEAGGMGCQSSQALWISLKGWVFALRVSKEATGVF